MIRTEVIVLNSSPVMEHDILIELFSMEYGRFRAFVKYAQSKKPRFGGLIHTLNVIKAELVQRRETFYLVNATLVSDYDGIKKSYMKMKMAYHMLSLVRAITQLNHQNSELYELIKEELFELLIVPPTDLHQFKMKFYHRVLAGEGLLGDFESHNYNEKQMIKMLESYTSVSIKDSV